MNLTCEFHYDSAHFLTGVPDGHKCARLHGHTYRLTVTLTGPVGDDGFVVDFADVKAAVGPVVAQLDHRLLNDIITNPTVENQLLWLWDRITLPDRRRSRPQLTALALREGIGNAAVYTGA